VYDPDDDQARPINAIQDQVGADGPGSNALEQFRALPPQPRKFEKTLFGRLDPIDQPVGGLRTVRCDMQPDTIQIVLGGRETKALKRHAVSAVARALDA
jgi:hypothetical protein